MGVQRIAILRVESPTLDGVSFGKTGPYEKLVGRVFGEVDPADIRNAVITDLELAPRNARGQVEYAADLYILRPVDAARGNHRVLFDVNNRGSMRAVAALNDSLGNASDPSREPDAGNGFLFRQGYTIVGSAWDGLVPPGDGRLTLAVPHARNPDGSPVVGLSLDEFVIDSEDVSVRRLTYPAASLDRTQARLTVRVRFADEPVPIPSDAWEYVDDRSVRLLPVGRCFENGRLYELTYPAHSPPVLGLGLAAQRDVAAFLRGAEPGANCASPLAGDVEHMYAFAISQPARFLHDFLQLGFNEDAQGRRVFDGVLNWLGGASGCFLNFRFAQPSRTHRQRIGRSYPELQFPFAFQTLTDPVTGEVDGLLRRCERTGTSPRLIEVNSANEYWAKAGSLLHTDPLGTRDLEDPEHARFYLLASFPHGAGSPRSKAIFQQFMNPLRAGATLRALLVALDEWVSTGREPPASRVPRLADATLVPPQPRNTQGFPAIPGVEYSGVHHEGERLDFGPDFKRGILGVLPPKRSTPYRALVPRTDVDGNDLAGVRVLEVAVPRATYTGWALRAGPAAGDGGDAAGQRIAFARTREERLQGGDPRLSLEERYPTNDVYVSRVRQEARALVDARFLLEEDATAAIRAAEARSASDRTLDPAPS